MYDAVIVGAGPAGSRAAWRLSREGARVALIDPSHPREKPCGGGVTGRALRLVADQIAGAPGALISGVAIARAIFIAGANRATVDLPRGGAFPPLVVYDRTTFDLAMFEMAIERGVTHVNARVREITTGRTSFQVHTKRGGIVEGRFVVGADGATSVVRRRMLAPFPRAVLSIAAGFFVRASTSTDVIVEFVADPPGYLWSFPRRDHLAIGVCAQADETTPARLRDIAQSWIRREAVPGTLQAYSWPVPSLTPASFYRQRPAGPGWILVGDAAGLVDPITREGIFFALQSADFAADVILQGSTDGRRYLDRIGGEILPELARAASLKAGFFRPQFMSLLVAALQASGRVRHVMADLIAGEQPYRTLVRRLAGTMEVGLAWRLMKMRRATR